MALAQPADATRNKADDLAVKLEVHRQWENVVKAGDVGKSDGDGPRAGVEAQAGDGSSGDKLMASKSETPLPQQHLARLPTSNPAQKTKSAPVLQADDLTVRLDARRQWETIPEGSASV